jgi:multiple sugar transport system substrate-binding protein
MTRGNQVREVRAARRNLSRREVMRVAGAAAAATGLGLFGGRAPAFAQGVTLRNVQIASFIPDMDAEFKAMATEFEKLHGCTMAMEFEEINNLLPKAIAAVELGSGPDVVMLQWNQAWLFNNGQGFADVGDIIHGIGEKQFYKINLDAVIVNGVYRGVPIWNVGSAMTYNKAICDPLGITKYPNTYEELLDAGRKLKKAGKPIGWCLGHTVGDAVFGNYPILWSYGGAEVDEKGRVIINSKGTREALKFMRAFWNEACDEGGMSWNDASNNQAYLGEAVGCILNAASAYVVIRRNARLAKQKGDEQEAAHWTALGDNTRHTVAPIGPHGRYHLIQQYNYHLPAYSKNIPLAKEWLKFLSAKPQYERMFRSGAGYAGGVSPVWEKNEIWKQDPILEPFKDLTRYGRNMGYKGPYNRGASEVQAKYIITDMFARAIQQDVESAVKWCEGELKLVYQAKV